MGGESSGNGEILPFNLRYTTIESLPILQSIPHVNSNSKVNRSMVWYLNVKTNENFQHPYSFLVSEVFGATPHASIYVRELGEGPVSEIPISAIVDYGIATTKLKKEYEGIKANTTGLDKKEEIEALGNKFMLSTLISQLLFRR
jgi:hypothetical protein